MRAKAREDRELLHGGARGVQARKSRHLVDDEREPAHHFDARDEVEIAASCFDVGRGAGDRFHAAAAVARDGAGGRGRQVRAQTDDASDVGLVVRRTGATDDDLVDLFGSTSARDGLAADRRADVTRVARATARTQDAPAAEETTGREGMVSGARREQRTLRSGTRERRTYAAIRPDRLGRLDSAQIRVVQPGSARSLPARGGDLRDHHPSLEDR